MQAIEQFRARYPQGGLNSEFVILDQGGYLVKATVQADGTTLATGLAAAETVEAAEDRARDRALAALGIGPVNLSRPLPPLSSELSQGLNPPLATPAASQQSGQAVGQAAETGALPRSLDVKPFPDLDLPAPAGTDFGQERVPNLSWDRDDPVAVPTEPSEPIAAPKPQAKAKKSAKAAATVPETVPAESPLGAAEIVTRAKAELKRLGWTREQGQKFLLERYGKRETRQLDDREWRDLYDYLYQQPNPTRSGGVS